MEVRSIARPRGAVLAGASLVALVLTLLLLPQPAPGDNRDGCGQVETVSSRRDVNPQGLEPYAFGDSVMHPAIFELAERGFNANSRGCRSFDEGVRLLRALERQDRLPHLVVMALGTDGRVTPEAIDRALGILGPERVLGLVTPRESGGGAKFDAVTMRRAAAENPRQIVLLDWVRYSRGHGTWFQPDGTHLTIPAGNGAFAAFLGRAIRFAREGRFSNGATIPAGGALPPPPTDVRPHGMCAGRRATISGTRAAERLVGTRRRDVIVGFGGGDEIFSRGGADLVCGGGGTDSLNGGAGVDDLHGGNGRDRILGGEGRDILRGQRQGDYLMGGADADVLAGGPSGRPPRSQDIAAFTGRIPVRASLVTNRASGHGRDVMRGVEGILGSFLRDVIYGDEGPNSLSGAASRDVIVAGPGHDLIGAGPADDTVHGGVGDDTIFGAQGDDDLFGDAGADTIEGYAGNDEIDGGPQDDPLLAGQAGDDSVLGGTGDDVLFGDFEPCRGPGCGEAFGDDALNGGSGGESRGDQGDGGPHIAADSCVHLESQADCEALGLPRSARRSGPLHDDGGAGAGRAKGFSFSAPSLYPSFDPERRFYVARCERGRLRVSIRARRRVLSRVGRQKARMGSYRIRRLVTPGHDFKVRVGSGRRGSSYQVRCLPEGFPAWRFEKLRRIPDGLFVLGSRAGPGSPPFVAIFDHDGVPRWWYRSKTRAINAQVLKAGTVAWSRAYGDGYGRDPRQAQEVHSLSGRLLQLISTKGSINDPHELFQEPNGNVLLESYVPRVPVDLRPWGGPRRGGIVYPRIQEQTSRGRVIRTVNLLDSLPPAETNGRWWDPILRNPRPGPRGIQVYDVIHVNSLEPWGKDKLVISTRHTDAVYGIDRRRGDVLWKLGGKPHPRSLRFVGEPNPPGQLFGGQHDARIYGRGTLTLFDNSQDRPRPPRGVIYRLDLKARTATLVRQLIDPKAERGNCCGSMRAIPGGWLVGFGDTPLVTAFTKSGKVAFRLNWGNSYRAMPVQRGHVSLGALDRGLERLERRGG